MIPMKRLGMGKAKNKNTMHVWQLHKQGMQSTHNASQLSIGPWFMAGAATAKNIFRFKPYHEETNGSHTHFSYRRGSVNPPTAEQWWKVIGWARHGSDIEKWQCQPFCDVSVGPFFAFVAGSRVEGKQLPSIVESKQKSRKIYLCHHGKNERLNEREKENEDDWKGV